MSTSSTLTFQNYGKHGIGRQKVEWGFLGDKYRTEVLLPVLVTLAVEEIEKNSSKKGEKTQGQIRHHNNTHAGQEESI